MISRTRIAEATGFDSGELFTSGAQVADYFTVANCRDMFGKEWDAADQAELDEMGLTVVTWAYHCKRGRTAAEGRRWRAEYLAAIESRNA